MASDDPRDPATTADSAEPMRVAEAVPVHAEHIVAGRRGRRGGSRWLWGLLGAVVAAGAVTAAVVVTSREEDDPPYVDVPRPPASLEELVARTPRLSLPITSLRTPPATANVKVILTETDVLVAGHETPIVHFDDPAAARDGGAPAALKRNGPNDLFITPLHSVLSWHIEHESPKESVSELVILADAATPYRLLFEVLYTAGQAGYGRYHFVVRGESGLSSITTTPPSTGSSRSLPSDGLNLTGIVIDDGVGLKTSFGNIAPGCGAAGGEITIGKGLSIPTRGGRGQYDLQTMRSCARALKSLEDGRFAAERAVTLTASRAIEYRHLIATIETLRGDGEELFPDFYLGVTK
jgi:hypothetical protein